MRTAPASEKVRAVPRDNTPPPPPPREVDDCWPRLLELFKSRLPMAKRAFLNMAGGRVEGDRLIVECDNELVKNTLSKDDVVEVFQTTAAEVLGRPVGVQVVTKAPGQPAARAGTAGSTPVAAPVSGGAPAAQSGGDPLDHLLSKMQGFDNLKIN